MMNSGSLFRSMIERACVEQGAAFLSLTPLPFYHAASLLRVITRDDRETAFVCSFGRNGDGSDSRFTLLDGSRAALAAANATEGLSLTDQTAVAYLSFYCEMLLYECGHNFRFVENMGEVQSAGCALTVDPPEFLWRDSDGRYICAGSVLYQNSVAFSVFAISPEGEVVMIDDDGLIDLD